MTIKGTVVDLSVTIENGMPFYPADPKPELVQHKTIASGGYNVKELILGTHTGTHVDAPIHVFEDGVGVDMLDPLACSGEAVVIDVRGQREIMPNELHDDLHGKVVLFYTGTSDKWKPGWDMSSFSYLGVEAARRLAAIGPLAVGIDSPSIEGPDSNRIVHMTLLSSNIVIIENLSSALGSLTGRSFYFLCLFLNIKDGDGSPARALGFLG